MDSEILENIYYFENVEYNEEKGAYLKEIKSSAEKKII